jgi:hypothetical protein
MKKPAIVLLSFFVTLFSYAQNDSINKGDCNFFNETINFLNYHKFIDTIGTPELACSISDNNYIQLINCLLSYDSVNPKLNFYKAGLSERKEITDTSFFRYYRVSIENDFKKGESYYNMGAFFINNLFSWQKDSMAMFGFLKNEQEKYLNLAEKYMWSSFKSGFKESIFAIGDIQNLKNEYLKTPKPRINLDQDTLTIVAQIMDCGEFGGHIEKIHLINNGDNYNTYFFSDSIYCMNEITRPSFNSKYNAKNTVIPKDFLIELAYAIDSYKDVGVLTNSSVAIAIVWNEHVLYQRIQDSRWPHYLEFRKKIFNF